VEAKIANNAVTTQKIIDNAINSNKIATGAIIESKLADGSVTNAKIGTIDASKITTGTLAAGVISTSSLASVFINTSANITSALTVQGATVVATGDLVTGDRIEHGGAESTTYIDIGQSSSFFLRPNGSGSGLLLSANGTSYIRSNFNPNLNNTYGLGSSVYKWTDVWAVDGTINTSDITLKTDVEETTLGLDFIDTLTPIEFKWSDGGVRTHLGFSAQDVKQKLIDAKGATQNYAMYVQGSYDTQNDVVDEEGNLVEEIPEGFETYGLRPQELIPVLVKAIQELKDRVEALE